ncbi:putative O-methyltransferase [Viridothelium virens]|uniref:Putative O-methyltransferase n=1 Tax=Viridothelium virens TaxID=1048519 RepID=A0A6A6GYX5_VIRVR|nr:putative O-methyltransferase [Viridothelium virens]
MSTKHSDDLVHTAEEILTRTSQLAKQLSQRSITPPSLAVGANSDLWTTHDGEIEALRSATLALTQRLDNLLEGPHGVIHEYVSTNWEYGALYTLLEFDILDKIPLDGSSVPATRLAEQAGLPWEKLLRICRLVATTGILQEPEEGLFAHTAISEILVKDPGFSSWVGFQLFETRVASANLADSLKKPNPYWTGQAAFEYAWGMPMYTWHAKNPEKGKRFAQAMQSVSQGLDPGNGMIIDWLTDRRNAGQDSKGRLIEVSGKTGSFSQQLATIFPNLNFEVQDTSLELLRQGEQKIDPSLAERVQFRQRDLFTQRSAKEMGESERSFTSTVFLLRGVLWNLPDSEAIKLLQSFLPAMQRHDRPLLLISDLVSPKWGTFEPHVERAFRRRDVTLMTMHNVKQRTATEWDELIRSASPQFKVTYREKYSSHSCRGLWQVELGDHSG